MRSRQWKKKLKKSSPCLQKANLDISPGCNGDLFQLSVFQCRLTRRRAELETRLRELVRNGEDHVLLIDVGPADKINPAVESIGRNFSKVERQAIVI